MGLGFFVAIVLLLGAVPFYTNAAGTSADALCLKDWDYTCSYLQGKNKTTGKTCGLNFPCQDVEGKLTVTDGTCTAPLKCLATKCVGGPCKLPSSPTTPSSGSGSATTPTSDGSKTSTTPTASAPTTPSTSNTGNTATPNDRNSILQTAFSPQTLTPTPESFSKSGDGLKSDTFTPTDLGTYQTVKSIPTTAGDVGQFISPQSMTNTSSGLVPGAVDGVTPTPVQTTQEPGQNYSSDNTFGGSGSFEASDPCSSIMSYSCLSSTAGKAWDATTYAAKELLGISDASARAGTVSQSYCLANAESCLSADAGQASYYDSRLGGINASGAGRTANGELPNMNDTAFASQRLPLNTVAEVCNTSSGDCVYARVNDTGAFDQPRYGNRIADLTPRTASEIGMNGLANVTITPVGIFSSGSMAKQVTDNLNNELSLGDAVSHASQVTGGRAVYTVQDTAESLPLSADTLRGFTGYAPAPMTIADNTTNWNALPYEGTPNITPETPPPSVPDALAGYGTPSGNVGTIEPVDWNSVNSTYSGVPSLGSDISAAQEYLSSAYEQARSSIESSIGHIGDTLSQQFGAGITPEALPSVPDAFAAYGQPSATIGSIENSGPQLGSDVMPYSSLPNGPLSYFAGGGFEGSIAPGSSATPNFDRTATGNITPEAPVPDFTDLYAHTQSLSGGSLPSVEQQLAWDSYQQWKNDTSLGSEVAANITRDGLQAPTSIDTSAPQPPSSEGAINDAITRAGIRSPEESVTPAQVSQPWSGEALASFAGGSFQGSIAPGSSAAFDWNQYTLGSPSFVTPEAQTSVPDAFAGYGQPSAEVTTIATIDWSNPPYSAAPAVSPDTPIADAFAPFSGDRSGLASIGGGTQLGSEVTPQHTVTSLDLEPLNAFAPTSPQDATTLTPAQEEAIAGAQSISRNLERGMSGQDVVALQDFLKEQGFFPENVGSTGYYGSVTERAVAAWQESIGLAAATGATYGVRGYGNFGPLSRAYVSTLR